jgi:Bacterial Ig-like domain
MKTPALLAAIAFTGLCTSLPAAEPTIDTMPPVVIKTVPEAGSTTVAPGVVEIKVTYSKPMRDQAWSWSSVWPGSEPEVVDKPKYEADGKTCVLKVKLEPNKTYGYWLNSETFKNFKDTSGRPAVPYLLTFKTGDK